MRVACYLRVSTDDRGQNLDTQRLPLRDYCRAQGWADTDVTEYADEAPATDLRARVSWRRLLDDAAKRRFDLLLVWRLDRMARSVLDAATTLERLRGWGVGLRSYCEPYIDTTSPFGEALFYITMAYAQLERGILRERVKAGMDRARRQGKHVGRPSRLHDPAVADQAAELLARVRAGTMTLRAAARTLGVSPTRLSSLLLRAQEDGQATQDGPGAASAG
jgi:DNA invertase Pin-like site-specific DNA recombinase